MASPSVDERAKGAPAAAAAEPMVLAALDEVDHSNPKVRQILKAARSLFLSHAYDAVSMEAVAGTAGVSKGTLYLYFKNKDALFAAMIIAELTKVTDKIWRQDSGSADIETALRRIGRNYVRLFGSSHTIDIYRSLISVSARLPALGRLFYERGGQIMMDRLAAFLAARGADGALDVPDPDLAAQQFLSLVRGNLQLREFLSAGRPPPEEIAAVIESGVSVFLKAYRARP